MNVSKAKYLREVAAENAGRKKLLAESLFDAKAPKAALGRKAYFTGEA
jgi:hypothetical protein